MTVIGEVKGSGALSLMTFAIRRGLCVRLRYFAGTGREGGSFLYHMGFV